MSRLALTFSFAESVWASTCSMPGMTVESEVGAFTDAPVPGDPSCSNHWTGEREEAPDHEGPCPFTSPLAAQACAGFVSMAAGHASLPGISAEGEAQAFALDTHTGLLLKATLFRPPRA